MDLGGSFLIDRLNFWSGANGNYSHPLTDFALQQWNGTQWETVHAVSGSTNTGVVQENFAETVVGSRIRLLVTGTALDSIVRLYELEVRGIETVLQAVASIPAANALVSDLQAPLAVEFNEAISLENPATIQLLHVPSNTLVTPLHLSVDNTVLTLSHPGLQNASEYRLIVPSGSVVLAQDDSETTGHIVIDFATVPVAPQIVDAPPAWMDVSLPYALTFDRAVTLLSAAAFELIDVETNSTVVVDQLAVNGASVEFSSSSVVAGRNYLLRVSEGAVADALTSAPNAVAAAAFHTGELLLFKEDFNSGLGSFATATSLGLVSGGPAHWQFGSTWAGPGSDFGFLTANFGYENDFAASPAVHLEADQSYVLNFQHHSGSGNAEGGIMSVYLSPTRDLNDLSFLGTIAGTFWRIISALACICRPCYRYLLSDLYLRWN
ncbi:MAG: hypothetical protein LR015_10900 [Verrucomicrobia bacterium]|nr:hypothetical protein [Verrucomicrobiota bacterium]